MIERIINILWKPDKDESFVHVSIFCPLNGEHEI
jgi:hypothetical protein